MQEPRDGSPTFGRDHGGARFSLEATVFGYIDPLERIHQQQALRNAAQPPAPPVFPQFQSQPVQSPLAGLDQAIQQVVPPYRQRSVLAGMVEGYAFGYLANVLWNSHRERRAARQAPQTVPVTHDARAIQNPQTQSPMFQARCSCGWRGNWRVDRDRVLADAQDHAVTSGPAA